MSDPKKTRLVSANLLVWFLQALYTVSPIDLIPDLIPILGWMDDGAGWVVTILFTIWTVRTLRKHGPKGLSKAKNTLENLERRGEQLPVSRKGEAPRYDPLPPDEILAL